MLHLSLCDHFGCVLEKRGSRYVKLKDDKVYVCERMKVRDELYQKGVNCIVFIVIMCEQHASWQDEEGMYTES